MESRMKQENVNRWRLLLGKNAADPLTGIEGYEEASFAYGEIDEILHYLYGREYGDERGYRRQGGQEGSSLTVPAWLSKIRTIFPKETVEILEKQALEKYNMTELLTDRTVLEKLEPNMHLLKSILQFKGYMKGEVIQSAKEIVRKVVEEIRRSLESEIQTSIIGAINRQKRGYSKSLKNLDVQRTIIKNLKNYDQKNKRFILDQLYFHSNVRQHNKWNIVILVDESGSMLDSVIYSAVMASIFSKLAALKTHLVIFDTKVVDLSSQLEDPIDLLMSVQLGGGTHIAKALKYGNTLLENPGRTIFILVSDLEEGYSMHEMYRTSQAIIDTGCKFLVLTALDFAGNVHYNKQAARTLSDMGAHVAAITPNELAQWIGKIIR
ncbi:VWA domain-containing protein [Aneurinibacillus migulanus]|uniref:CoxE n=1 Tax=Aneurinibacillus migulanus TaxID=47500 RepID=A0A0D1X8R0_ANEMI|nr:VWA domain-containing protein [Aneurinibacillus migulanus]KIV50826.1 CoxE [Aneurinibacillus migulanus]KON97072.1 CoxE [Aneurinibacillus migulanus]MED0894214.1 VWA domain-containing protein [Aneurinibacillus migulanus]MED1616960.1 VWA domain-containing protein [Aneurinibacillus migulanus]SDJ94352.1 VWA domain containing CoxE-like protein [Aneurinibacillus migulanus]